MGADIVQCQSAHPQDQAGAIAAPCIIIDPTLQRIDRLEPFQFFLSHGRAESRIQGDAKLRLSLLRRFRVDETSEVSLVQNTVGKLRE